MLEAVIAALEEPKGGYAGGEGGREGTTTVQLHVALLPPPELYTELHTLDSQLS